MKSFEVDNPCIINCCCGWLCIVVSWFTARRRTRLSCQRQSRTRLDVCSHRCTPLWRLQWRHLWLQRPFRSPYRVPALQRNLPRWAATIIITPQTYLLTATSRAPASTTDSASKMSFIPLSVLSFVCVLAYEMGSWTVLIESYVMIV